MNAYDAAIGGKIATITAKIDAQFARVAALSRQPQPGAARDLRDLSRALDTCGFRLWETRVAYMQAFCDRRTMLAHLVAMSVMLERALRTLE